jgi:hypothetical protein
MANKTQQPARRSFLARAARSLWGLSALWAAATAPAGALAQTFGDITFFAASDLHYGFTNWPPFSADISRGTLDRMNALPGQPYPAGVGGGTVAVPRGVLLIGDLTEDGSAASWSAFTNDWGLNGEQRLAYPVYEGWGNHDGFPSPVPDGVKARNLSRTGISNISTNGYHYSWDWDYLHLVCLNLYPGNKASGDWSDPKNSLAFLADDLASRVGTSGRPIIIYHHYGMDSFSTNWWSNVERSNYLQVLQDYNVIAILAGHNHDLDSVPWNGLATYNDGTAGKWAGDFLVVHLAENQLVLAEWTSAGAWGSVYTQTVSVAASPRILVQPQCATVPVSANATLSLRAVGTSLKFQWFFNTNTPIPDATNSTLVLTDVQLAQSGSYQAVVANPAGSVVSEPAVLTVLPLLGIQPGPTITLFGDLGTTLTLQFRDSLDSSSTWAPLATITLTNSPQLYFDDSAATQPQRFYRTVPAAAP